MELMDLPTILTAEPSKAIDAPQWFIDLQQQAWQTFQNTPAPTAREENWRFGNRKQLAFDDFTPAAYTDTADLDLKIEGLEEASAQFIFANDGLVHAEADLPEGVICLPL